MIHATCTLENIMKRQLFFMEIYRMYILFNPSTKK